MSLTFEEIRKRFDNDTMHASIVPYVKPLLERIEQLEHRVKGLQKEKQELISELPDY